MTTDGAADTMKAVYFEETGGTDVLRFGDVPRPQPGNGQALVRVLACGVNRLDIYARTGRTPVKLPHTSGSEAAGEVVGYGPGIAMEPVPVGRLAAVAPYLFCGQCEFCLAGEETMCIRGDILGLASQGAFAEYVVVPASSLVPLPDGVNAQEAAAVGLAMITAWRMLIERAKVQPGETVLVQAGGSGVGSAAIQIAKLAGARVIATVGSREKMEHAQRLGADNVINYNELDFAQEVRKLTGKRGVSVLVEHIGAATWAASIDLPGARGSAGYLWRDDRQRGHDQHLEPLRQGAEVDWLIRWHAHRSRHGAAAGGEWPASSSYRPDTATGISCRGATPDREARGLWQNRHRYDQIVGATPRSASLLF